MKEHKGNLKQVECKVPDEGLRYVAGAGKQILCDLKIKITGVCKKQRGVVIQKGDKRYTLLTNGFDLPKEQIAEYYSMRWNIENFFKVLKEDWHLNKFPTTNYKGLRFYVEMVLYAYNVHISYRMHTGRHMGIKQMRQKEFEIVIPNDVIPKPASLKELARMNVEFFAEKVRNFFGS